MEPLRAVKNRAVPALAACLLLLSWTGSVAAGEGQARFTETKLLAPDGFTGDEFGSSVAISGNTAIIGSPNDDESGSDSGSVYLFERDPRDPAVWTLTDKLTVLDFGYHIFGSSVAIAGDTAVVGGYNDDPHGPGSGSAYVFERDPFEYGQWVQVAKLTAADGAREDYFGHSVAISGDTVVIGAHLDDEFDSNSGSAYVFQRDPFDPTDWNQTAKLTIADGDIGQFGQSVAISGDTAVIGALSGDYAGSAYVFQRDPVDVTAWTQVAKLIASDGGPGDVFGRSVAVSGDTLVIGADMNDDLGVTSGSAYVFQRHPFDPADWNQTAKLTAADGERGDHFGYSVAISGDTAVIGAFGDGVTGAYWADGFADRGSAYVFKRDPLARTVWNQTAKLTASDGINDDYFGRTVAISRETAVIGAQLRDDFGSKSGAAYVYSAQGCELGLALEPLTLRAGEELRVAVDLHHRRPITVTVPFLLWVEDATGHVVARKSSQPVTMAPADHRQLRMAVTLPQGMQPGIYRVLVGVKRMQQGIAWGSQEIRVVE